MRWKYSNFGRNFWLSGTKHLLVDISMLQPAQRFPEQVILYSDRKREAQKLFVRQQRPVFRSAAAISVMVVADDSGFDPMCAAFLGTSAYFF